MAAFHANYNISKYCQPKAIRKILPGKTFSFAFLPKDFYVAMTVLMPGMITVVAWVISSSIIIILSELLKKPWRFYLRKHARNCLKL